MGNINTNAYMRTYHSQNDKFRLYREKHDPVGKTINKILMTCFFQNAQYDIKDICLVMKF